MFITEFPELLTTKDNVGMSILHHCARNKKLDADFLYTFIETHKLCLDEKDKNNNLAVSGLNDNTIRALFLKFRSFSGNNAIAIWFELLKVS